MIKIFGKVPFNRIDKEELFDKIIFYSKKNSKTLISNMNAYGVVTYLKNKRYRKIINTSKIIYPDGWGPVLASLHLPQKLDSRLNVGDFIFDLLKQISKHHLKIYLIGCEQPVIEKTVGAIRKRYPKINISGFHNGFPSKKQNLNLLSDLNRKKPNLVFVGMGVPYQEYWIQKNLKSLPNALYMGVGGVFHYIAGTKRRAPLIIRKMYLEWVFRFFQEPNRLFKRYTLANLIFIKEYFRSTFESIFFR